MSDVPVFSNVPEHDGPTVTLHSTWLGVLMSYVGAALFVLFAGGLLYQGGPRVFTIVLFATAVVFAVVAAFDLPIAAEFRRDGVIRRAALRHQFLDWDSVTRLQRLRLGLLKAGQGGRGGGLVAKIGRRNFVLVDTMESALEFDELFRVLGEQAGMVGLDDVVRPSDERHPTWLYRRDRWKPESARRSSATKR